MRNSSIVRNSTIQWVFEDLFLQATCIKRNENNFHAYKCICKPSKEKKQRDLIVKGEKIQIQHLLALTNAKR